MISGSRTGEKIRTLIVEDEGMFRAFLVNWLGSLPGYLIVGVAGRAEEALSIVSSGKPDLMIVDFQLPGMDGLEFVRSARQLRPQARTLILSSLMDPLALTRVRESGVEGYLEKDATPEMLAEALEAVGAGEKYYSARLGEILAENGRGLVPLGRILSRREQEVLTHVLRGKTSREIGEIIGLSARTVEFHRGNIMGKMGAANVTELVANAERFGFR